MVGINSNLAAASATGNLNRSNSIVSDSIARLSSGNRIVKASDDVAGLSIGTAIKSTVTSLQVALLNTEQARSVLQIADGALSQISDILSRQKALATQANSGSLGATERGYLNQEFTSLTSEIDRIVGSTSFNGITLLNGSIAGNATTTVAAPAETEVAAGVTPAAVAVGADVNNASTGYTAVGAIVADGVITTSNISVDLSSFDDPEAQGPLGATFTAVSWSANGGSAPETAVLRTRINGVDYISGTITSSSGAGGGNIGTGDIDFTATDGSGSIFTISVDVALTGAIDTNATGLATSLTNALANVEIYQARDVSGLATPATASVLNGVGTVQVYSNDFDTTNNDFGNIGSSAAGFSVTAGDGTGTAVISVTLNGKTFNASAFGGSNDNIANNEDIILYGRDSLGDVTGETLTINIGTLTNGTIDLANATDVADLETALNDLFGIDVTEATTVTAYSTSALATNDYIASVGVTSFDDATYQTEGFGTFSVSNFNENSGTEQITLETTLGDKTYVSNLITSSGNSGDIAAQTITFTAEDGSAFSIAASAVTGTTGDDGIGLDDATTAANYAAELTTALADVSIYSTRVLSSVDATAVSNTVLEGLTATSVTIKSNNFDTTNNDFGDVGQFTGVAGSGALNTLSVVVNGTTFNANDIGGSDDTLAVGDANITLLGRDAAGNATGEEITISLTGLTRSLDLTNQDEVDSLVSALDAYFGVGANGSGGLSFQVGSSVTDNIAISVASVETTTIYKDADDVYTDISIDTQSNAQTAIGVLDNAIGSVIARRADIGAATSRFNFAANNIESSITNQDAARGKFLDADIATESTSFASYQVKLQASVAVLSQANNLPRNLLSLLQG